MSEKSNKNNSIGDDIVLISENERWIYKKGRSKIYYTRLTEDIEKETKENHTEKGLTDYAAVAQEWLEKCIIGWEDIPNFLGEESELNNENIRRLPAQIKLDLLDCIKASNGQRAPIKN